jgi:hypothetical protein
MRASGAPLSEGGVARPPLPVAPIDNESSNEGGMNEGGPNEGGANEGRMNEGGPNEGGPNEGRPRSLSYSVLAPIRSNPSLFRR